MSRYRSKLLHALVAMILLAVSALLWLSLGASATYASCVPSNSVCITNSPAGALTLNGTDQTLSYVLTFTLNNSVQGAWHVTITSTQFTSGSNTLPVNASIVTAVATASACSGGGNSCPSNSITPPVGVPVPPTPPATFYDNTPGGSQHGVGTFNIQATINVTVPGSTYAGTYTSTITIALLSGP